MIKSVSEEDANMTFAEQCVFVRTKLFLTQSNLAKKIGVSVATIARWETQNRKPQAIQYGKFLNFCNEQGIAFDKKTGDIL